MVSICAKNISLYYSISSGHGNKFKGGPSSIRIVTEGKRRYLKALDKVNFDVKDGQRIGLVGPNGSGKSTLLRVLGGMFPPTIGRVTTVGKVSSLFNIQLGVQPEVSGRENIIMRGIINGWDRKQIHDNLDRIIEYSDLEDFIELPFRTYSDGMKMRLLFSVATAFSPEILLLDEWIGAGDANFQAKAGKRMMELVSESGITVIASHNDSLLSNVCSHGIWLQEGKMKAYGEINEVLEQKNNFMREKLLKDQEVEAQKLSI